MLQCLHRSLGVSMREQTWWTTKYAGCDSLWMSWGDYELVESYWKWHDTVMPMISVVRFGPTQEVEHPPSPEVQNVLDAVNKHRNHLIACLEKEDTPIAPILCLQAWGCWSTTKTFKELECVSS